MKNITIGTGEKCKKCGGQNYILKHATITDKMKQRDFYYSQWERCVSCATIWFDPKYIVSVRNEKARQAFEEDGDNLLDIMRTF